MTTITTIAVILAVLWMLGLATGYTFGGFIYMFLALAIATLMLRSSLQLRHGN